MSALDALSQLQRLLMSVHGVEETAQAKDYLVGAAVRERVAPEASADEALLVSETGDELHVGLFLGGPVLAQLARGAEAPWSHERLHGFCAAAEGVSHFLYLLHRARARRPVSQGGARPRSCGTGCSIGPRCAAGFRRPRRSATASPEPWLRRAPARWRLAMSRRVGWTPCCARCGGCTG